MAITWMAFEFLTVSRCFCSFQPTSFLHCCCFFSNSCFGGFFRPRKNSWPVCEIDVHKFLPFPSLRVFCRIGSCPVQNKNHPSLARTLRQCGCVSWVMSAKVACFKKTVGQHGRRISNESRTSEHRPQAEKHRAWRRVQSVSLRSIGSIDPDPDSIPIVGTSWMLIVHGIITWYNGL